ncbi:MAG TPA: hypothetical protein VG818_01085, partial [Gemmatimonadaceae bacterium]|nr:hypothetical protein [Gemmatimonadaceae bacterium]
IQGGGGNVHDRTPDNQGDTARGRNGEAGGAAGNDAAPRGADGGVIPVSRLREAVRRGVISPAQLDALLAEGATLDAHVQPAPAAVPETAVSHGDQAEARRGLNAVSIAYAAGGAAVLFAFGWVLVDRWRELGAPGVLAVSLLYAAIFALCSRYLARQAFHTAAAIAALLAVGMTPLATWAMLNVTGWWYDPAPMVMGPYTYIRAADVLEGLRWVPIELATTLVALVTLRRVHFALLVLPVAIALPLVAGHLLPLVAGAELDRYLAPWMTLLSATVLIGAGYTLDQRTSDGEDYARWVYLTGVVTLLLALVATWGALGRMRHALPLVAVLLFTLSLYLRRTMFLVAGAVVLVSYLAYLAFDVFRRALGFPVLLATFGLAIILVTVLLQRRYPALARQVRERQGARRTVPGAWLGFAGAVVVAAALLLAQVPEARGRMHDDWANRRAMVRHMRRLEREQPRKGSPAPARNPAPGAAVSP